MTETEISLMPGLELLASDAAMMLNEVKKDFPDEELVVSLTRLLKEQVVYMANVNYMEAENPESEWLVGLRALGAFVLSLYAAMELEPIHGEDA